MSRPTKATVDYFPMDCTLDDRISAVENLYGNAGFIVWVKLNQKLGRSENHIIDLRNSIQRKIFFSIFKMDENVVTEILGTLAELNCIDKTLWKNQLIYSADFVERVADAYEKRIVKPLSYEEIFEFYQVSGVINEVSVVGNSVSGYGNPQRKQKETKEKESKEKHTQKKEKKIKQKETKEEEIRENRKKRVCVGETSSVCEEAKNLVCDEVPLSSANDNSVCVKKASVSKEGVGVCDVNPPISDEDMEILRNYASKTAKNVDAYVSSLIRNGSYAGIVELQKQRLKRKKQRQEEVFLPPAPVEITPEEDAKIRETMRKLRETIGIPPQ